MNGSEKASTKAEFIGPIAEEIMNGNLIANIARISPINVNELMG
jgi:hypothetical protein